MAKSRKSKKSSKQGKKKRSKVGGIADHRISMAVTYAQWRQWQRIREMMKMLGMDSVHREMGQMFHDTEQRLERHCKNAGIDLSAMQIKQSPNLVTNRVRPAHTENAPPGIRLKMENADFFDPDL